MTDEAKAKERDRPVICFETSCLQLDQKLEQEAEIVLDDEKLDHQFLSLRRLPAKALLYLEQERYRNTPYGTEYVVERLDD